MQSEKKVEKNICSIPSQYPIPLAIVKSWYRNLQIEKTAMPAYFSDLQLFNLKGLRCGIDSDYKYLWINTGILIGEAWIESISICLGIPLSEMRE